MRGYIVIADTRKEGFETALCEAARQGYRVVNLTACRNAAGDIEYAALLGHTHELNRLEAEEYTA